MDKELTFGSFLSEKRKDRGVILTDLAAEIGVSKVYLCDIEKGRKAAPKSEHLEKIAAYLKFNEEERNLMYDLAANGQACKKGISPDLPDYIMDNDIVRVDLRTAKQYDIDDDEWQEFIDKIKARGQKP